MVLSRVLALLSITLCLAACLCAHAAVSKQDAEKAVADLQQLTTQTLEQVKLKYTSAKRVKKSLEFRKADAENAASEAAAAAEGNKEAEAFANKAQSELQEFMKLHQGAKTKAEEALPAMESIKKTAEKVNTDAQIDIPSDAADYAEVTAKVTNLRVVYDALVQAFEDAKGKLDAANAELLKLEDHARKAQVANHQAKAVVSVAKMESLLSNADADINDIQKKKANVDATVKEIDEAFEKAPKKLISLISGFRDNAKDDLSQISGSVKQVQEDKKAMLNHKNKADEFLAKIKTETDENNAREHLQAITTHTEQAEESLKKINKAMSSADAHVKNANKRKEGMFKIFSPSDKKPTPPAKDGAKKPADKEGVPAFGGSNDSAMTVSFSLLLALIACAALH